MRWVEKILHQLISGLSHDGNPQFLSGPPFLPALYREVLVTETTLKISLAKVVLFAGDWEFKAVCGGDMKRRLGGDGFHIDLNTLW